MGSQITAEEIKQEFVSKYPPNSGLLAYYLWNDIADLHQNWKNYRILYGTDEETIDLLNEFAPSFFSSLDRILRHEFSQLEDLLIQLTQVETEKMKMLRSRGYWKK